MLALALIVVVICAVRTISKTADGDFKLHWEFGRRFLAGEFLYTHPHPYPPFWAMVHAPLALLPLPVAKAVLFPAGVAALAGLISILGRMASAEFELDATKGFWVATFALVLASRYVIRDMAEVGANTSLVLLTWLAIYLWRRKRDALAATSLGAAIALKCTPALFAAFFLWKRQWRMAGLTAAATAGFTLAPMIWQGPASYTAHLRTWASSAWLATNSIDPNAVTAWDPLRNMSLGATLGTYLETSTPAVRRGLVTITLLALVCTVFGWCHRRPSARDDPRLVWEFSAVGIVMLLLSPVTWGQHCVALLPACYFVVALIITRRQLPGWMWVLLGTYVLFVLVLSRDVVGRDLALRLGSYHIETLAMLGLLAVVLGARRWHISAMNFRSLSSETAGPRRS